jgi:Na+-translocating ferredoxin:NAD+ oxidoreductase RNF subunit RnfB
MSDVYQQLRKQLDQYSVGYPATASGVEIRILKKLFTEEEAGMYLKMTMMLESPAAAAQRIGLEPGPVAALLDQMAEKGLLFRHGSGEKAKYAASPFVVGIYEYQLPTMDREFAEMMEQYYEEAFGGSIAGAVNVLRPIPIGRSIPVQHKVAIYDESREVLKKQKRIAVANCICRVQRSLVDKNCDKPVEVCLVFGSHADYYVGKKMGRMIGVDEALAIMDRAEEAGLVSQPFNAQNPGGMCNCCGDCCGLLRSLNRMEKPALQVMSNYRAEVDEGSCSGCEVCLDRCQMAAIKMTDDGLARVNPDRCIGCGLCVTTCATEAMKLLLKPEAERTYPPESGMQHAMEMAQKRGASLTPLFMEK